MQTFFKELFEYSHHFNQKLGTVIIEKQESISKNTLKLYNHIINAHHFWNHRIEAKKTDLGVWDLQSMEACLAQDKINFEHSIRILDQFELTKNISYTNTKGLTFNNSIQDGLFHVVNHSNYHRAQIATDMKKNDIEPITSDYIFYKR